MLLAFCFMLGIFVSSSHDCLPDSRWFLLSLTVLERIGLEGKQCDLVAQVS